MEKAWRVESWGQAERGDVVKVEVLSDTIQRFNGVKYYLCGRYFQHGSCRLHTAVWKYHHGEIPHGYHSHHSDGNRFNNQLENLRLLRAYEHASYHAKSRSEYNKRHIEEIRPLAAEWHGSPEGRAWHSKRGHENWEMQKARQYVCTECGAVFMTKHAYGKNQNTFCSNNCKTRFRAKSGVDNEVRVCAYCGREFMVNKYSKIRYCSHECSVNGRWNK